MIKIHLAGIFYLKKEERETETDTWGQETELEAKCNSQISTLGELLIYPAYVPNSHIIKLKTTLINFKLL